MRFDFFLPPALSILANGPWSQWTASLFANNTIVGHPAALAACMQLQNSTSIPVFYPGSLEFEQHIKHWAPSSTQVSTCSVGPRTTFEVGEVLRAVGEHQSPFAVKGGGHATNANFSSTVGVQISMSEFREITYSSETSSVRVGTGLLWDDIYAALEPHGVSVAGSRISGVGVAGFALGGGYSWIANEVGLTLDTILEFELVKPDGEAVNVTKKSHPDLFFAVRGGWHNFGIVTSLTLKTFPQTEVFSGTIVYSEDQFNAFNEAAVRYAVNVKDPKSQVGVVMTTAEGATTLIAFLWYNGPKIPKGVFDDFYAIPSLVQNFKRRSFTDLMSITAPLPGSGLRVTYDTVGLLDTPVTLVAQMKNQSEFYVSRGAARVNMVLEPLMDSVNTFSPSPAAYPHPPKHALRPLCTSFFWEKAEEDELWLNASRSATQVIYEQALREGQDIDAQDGKQIRYGNYAAVGTSVKLIWGDNIDRLREIQAKVDPERVMQLASGWRL